MGLDCPQCGMVASGEDIVHRFSVPAHYYSDHYEYVEPPRLLELLLPCGHAFSSDEWQLIIWPDGGVLARKAGM